MTPTAPRVVRAFKEAVRACAAGLLVVTVSAGCTRASPPEPTSNGDAAPASSSASAAPSADSALAATDDAGGATADDAGAGALPSLEGKTVLHVGDSMVGGSAGLTRALEARFTAAGATYVRDYKVSESIGSYGRSTRLATLLARHTPDVVLVTLGANDVFLPHPEAMIRHVQAIVARIGARECYWLGPPTWKPDTGIVAILRDHVAPCRFYDGSGLELPRAADGIHPTDRGGAAWARAFWAFYRPGDHDDDGGP